MPRRYHGLLIGRVSIASLLLPQVGDVHDLFRACETAERVLRWSWISGSRRRSSTWAGGRPCVATDLNRDSPDESQTRINVRVFPALLQDRREVLTATNTSGNPNAWSRSDLAIFPDIWTHSFCRLLLNA